MGNKVNVTPYGDRAILITRSFNAPRTLVFDAMSKAEMIGQWLHGPPGWTMSDRGMDLRPGGRYRWAWRNDDGREMGVGGEVLEVSPPERLVTTEQFDDAWHPGIATNMIELSEANGITTMRLTITYESMEARDGVLAGPMTSGLDASYGHLDVLLASLT
ncbi:MAG: SRPBCC family protein [Flavobacteriales bacterium]